MGNYYLIQNLNNLYNFNNSLNNTYSEPNVSFNLSHNTDDTGGYIENFILADF